MGNVVFHNRENCVPMEKLVAGIGGLFFDLESLVVEALLVLLGAHQASPSHATLPESEKQLRKLEKKAMKNLEQV
ncbi:unnamed protein product [Ilex paraguariensis]|uniref:Uncharacterized protein n=1 Tax=Ilex paraguariensis TaxID=185542 RepID=A0ABC8RV19_9AQUA